MSPATIAVADCPVCRTAVIRATVVDDEIRSVESDCGCAAFLRKYFHGSGERVYGRVVWDAIHEEAVR